MDFSQVGAASDIFNGASEVGADGVANALGFGSVNDLLKAMTVGDEFPATVGDLTPGRLMATVPQDLDDTLANAAFDERQIILFNLLAKSKVWSTVHQYVRKQSPGSAGRHFLFHQEGGLPVESDSTYTLESLKMKYAGSVRRLPIQARLVKSIAGNTVKEQNKDGALEILSAVEYHLFYGDDTVNPFAFEGIYRAMHREGIVLDAKGATPTEGLIDEAMALITARPNWGYPTHMFSSSAVHRTLRQTYADRMRVMMGDRFTPNYKLKEMEFEHNAGDDRVQIIKHPHSIEEAQVCVETGLGPDAARRPVVPLVIQQPAAANNADSLFEATGPRAAGTFIYRAVAMNESGWSQPVTLDAVVTAAGQANTFILRDGAVPGSRQRATGFIIYRTTPGEAAATATEIIRIPATAGGGNTTFVDLNEDLPGTSEIFILSLNAEAIEWKQLLPFFNFPLGNLDTSYRWALLLFGALKIGLPRHHCVIKNVAPAANLARQAAESDQTAPQAHV